MEKCVVCNKDTTSFVNINFTKTPVCNSCCNAIMLQQATWLAQNDKTKDK